MLHPAVILKMLVEDLQDLLEGALLFGSGHIEVLHTHHARAIFAWYKAILFLHSLQSACCPVNTGI